MWKVGDNPRFSKEEQEVIDKMTESIVDLIEPCVRQRLGQYMELIKDHLKGDTPRLGVGPMKSNEAEDLRGTNGGSQ